MPLFAPYCGGLGPELEQALGVLLGGRFEGMRGLSSGGAHTYELRWRGAQAPLEQASCELSFPEQPHIHYSFKVPAHHLVLWLAHSQATSDLPDGFWRWLILGDDSAA